jgi:ketosteroid isomerase-like protein
VETKAEFIEGVMNRKSLLKSLMLSDHTIAIVGNDAIARHTWASESETDGKPTSTKIGVLQVWQKQGGAWKLLARQAFRTQPA